MNDKNLIAIRVGMPEIPGYMLIPYAKSKGYFEREGVDVKVDFIANGIDKAIPRFAKGEYDVFSGTNTMYASNPDLFEFGKWVYTLYFSTGGMAIVARKGIDSLWEAKGKKFSSLVGSKFTIAWIIKRYALTLDDVIVVEDPIGDIPGRVERGEVDYGYVPAPFFEHLREKGHQIVFSSSEEPGLVTLGFIFSDSFLSERRPDALGFLRGYVNALMDVRKDAAEFIAYVAKEVGSSAEIIERLYRDNVHLLDLEENVHAFAGEGHALSNIKMNLRYISLFLAGQGQAHTVDPDKGVVASLVNELVEEKNAKKQ